MTFEAQDEFYIAKFLAPAGAEVKVGDPILVTVEDAKDVPAFEKFSAPNAAPATSAPKVETPAVKKEESKPTPASAKPSQPAAPANSAPKPTPQPAAPVKAATQVNFAVINATYSICLSCLFLHYF